jgi:uncharacterized protein YkwD
MTPHQTLHRLCAAGALLASVALGGCASIVAHAEEVSDRAAGYGKVSSQEPVKMTREELDVLMATNRYRKEQGLTPLEADARLTAIARLRSQDMAKRNYFSHVTPDGGDVFSLMRTQRVKFWAAGENLARNDYPIDRAPDVAMQGWIKSPGHRANLVHPAFGHLGVGLAVAKDGKKYLTQVFTD